MKYLCLVYNDEANLDAMSESELNALVGQCLAYDQGIRDSGHCIASEALKPVDTAVTVRVRNGKLSVSDGPFAETKEQLGGFYLIDAANLEEATQLAAKIPSVRMGSIEVRPIWEIRRQESRYAPVANEISVAD